MRFHLGPELLGRVPDTYAAIVLAGGSTRVSKMDTSNGQGGEQATIRIYDRITSER